MPRDGERALFSNDPARAARALHLRVDRPPTRRTRENPSLNETHAPLSVYASAITRTNARNLSFPHVARETIATTRETDGGWYETDEPRRRAAAANRASFIFGHLRRAPARPSPLHSRPMIEGSTLDSPRASTKIELPMEERIGSVSLSFSRFR